MNPKVLMKQKISCSDCKMTVEHLLQGFFHIHRNLQDI